MRGAAGRRLLVGEGAIGVGVHLGHVVQGFFT